MNAGGWTILVLSVGFVTFLFAWCIYKVLTAPAPGEKLHAQPGVDTHDRDD